MKKSQKIQVQHQGDPFLIIKNYRKMVNRGVRLHKKRKQKYYPPTNIKTRRMEIREKQICQVENFLDEDFDSELHNSYHGPLMQEESLQIHQFASASQIGESQQLFEGEYQENIHQWDKMDVDNLFMANSTQFNDNFLLQIN